MKAIFKFVRIALLILIAFKLAPGATWYVHPDSTLNSIQDALNICASFDTILVGTGTYYENIAWPAKVGIKLLSEQGPDSAIIDGSGTASVIIIDTTDIDTTTIINGFTIRNGYEPQNNAGGIWCWGASPTISGNRLVSNNGAAIACWECAPVIRENVITQNNGQYGGGIHMHYAGGVRIIDNTISSNSAQSGGGIYCLKSTPLIQGNNIVNNTATARGGGLCFFRSLLQVIGNVIDNNSADLHGGGIEITEGYDILIRDNTITNNSADSLGGGVCCYYLGEAMIRSNIIESNAAKCGGGICNWHFEVTVMFNTIRNNVALYFGGGYYCNDGYPGQSILCNNIEDNVNYGVYNADTSMLLDAENNWWGDVTGPYHPTMNPNGQGDWVSDHVDYDPWLDHPFGIEEEELPISVATDVLLHNNPNPFHSHTAIRFSLNMSSHVVLRVYDVAGRCVGTLVDRMYDAGIHDVVWVARDSAGARFPAGLYFCVLNVGSYRVTKKMLLLN